MRWLACLALALSACSFSSGERPTNTDAGPDAPPPLTIGFAKMSESVEESVTPVSLRVVLSAPADEPITVTYSVAPPPATSAQPEDFVGGTGTLTFAPGDVEKTIDIEVVVDDLDESDEDVVLTLDSVSGANAILGTTINTMTISSNTLPRVTFVTPTSSGNEATSPTIDVVLDKASQVQMTVDVVVSGGSATGGGVDYTFATTTLTFDAGETMKQITLPVANDMMDENDEDVVLGLSNPTSVVVGTASSHTHTITDDDNAPTVQFTTTSSTISEAGTSINVEISVSQVSGKSFDVPFTITGTATGGGTDYTIVTTSPVAFAAGTATQNVQITIVNDTAAEPSETIILTLGTPNPGTNATLGANTVHTVTITDNDSTCLGTGTYQACFANPSTAQNLPAALNTDSSPLCSSSAPLSGWTGQPASCFIVATNITANAAITVTGTKPLVLFASGNVTINASIDVSSHLGAGNGPGANSSLCATYTDNPANQSGGNGAGGGAGGSFRSAGGNGGNGGVNTGNSGGSATGAVGAPTVLRGGCAGQNGGNGSTVSGSNAGPGGAGGGAIYIVAGGTLTITNAAINASGAAGNVITNVDSGFRAGGGGGGSGGMIKLHATTFSFTNAVLMANGGGGSSAGDMDAPGIIGLEPTILTPTVPAPGGPNVNGGGAGGSGFAGTTPAVKGTDDSNSNGGGGGGGGGGHIEGNNALTGAVVSAGP